MSSAMWTTSQGTPSEIRLGTTFRGLSAEPRSSTVGAFVSQLKNLQPDARGCGTMFKAISAQQVHRSDAIANNKPSAYTQFKLTCTARSYSVGNLTESCLNRQPTCIGPMF
ncbi:hypothetical protein LTR24_002295 [Lithohypha guttulata]|uniref:Uncharacterized protein n=1 Tax=Lithohypha guttulata TaxID=1690604 RepID=A0ABR0KI16_9EURO|nr:hypothetical protein LTR24_002295 [Lithohypha guttulata]